MESEWIEGEDGIAANVWRSSHTKWGWVFARLFIGCLIVVMLTGELWPDPLQLPVNIAIMAIVPAMGAKWWQRHERIDVPSGLIGVGTDRLPVEPLSLYEGNADDDPMLSPVKAVLWQRGMRGEFACPVRADGQLMTGMFTVNGDRIRLTGTHPADPAAKAMVDKNPESFDKAFPNPTVIADSNQWIAYDPNGRPPQVIATRRRIGSPCQDVAVKHTAELFVGNVRADRRASEMRAQRVRNYRTSCPAKRS